MPTSFSNTCPDFKDAAYTAIISDLHLTEAEPVNLKHPLWKKYKTREFFYDDVFGVFLKHLETKAQGAPVELVLNGDIFDFDSVVTVPADPVFRVHWLEKSRGLYPQEERSRFKIDIILRDHTEFVTHLKDFILRGNRAVFVIGNHDIELHFPTVQAEIIKHLNLPLDFQQNIRFVEWFYISNKDTLIEHGNQYDPYCICEDPINPFVKSYNHISLKLPFGNLACRYILNAMGFFNPHVETNFIMSLKQYILFFLKYIVKAQPFIVLTWLFGSLLTLMFSFFDRLASPIRNPLTIEDRIQEIAEKSNAETRMVRELKELFVAPAASNPFSLARELWLDRAFLVFIAFFVILQAMFFIRAVYEVSFFWGLIPLFIMLPFFLFYSKSVSSLVGSYKEPDDRILAMASAITNVKRIVYGHTHHVRHEIIGSVEHLNSGCWSPAFLDVECTKPIDQKTYVWISPSETGNRQAEVFRFDTDSETSLS